MGGIGAIARVPVLRLSAFLLFGFATGIASFAPYLSTLGLRVFGLPDLALSAVLVTGALVAVLSSVSLGLVTDLRQNRRRIAILTATAWLAGGASVALWPSPVTFILAHSLLLPIGGALFGQVFVLVRIETTDHPDREGIAAAIRAVFSLSFILILPLWSAAIAAGVPLVSVYTVLGLTGAALLAAVLLRWPADMPGHQSPGGTDIRGAVRALRSPSVLLRLGAIGMIKSPVALYMVLLGLLFARAGRPDADTALFAGLVAGLEIPVMLATGAMLRRLPKPALIALAALLHAGFLLAFAAFAGQAWVWALALPAAAAAAVILTVPIGYLQDLMADRPGAGGALIALHQFAGDAIMGAVFAAGTLIAGYGFTAALGAAVAVAGAAALLWADRRDPQRPII
jgi:predicted MFS family arabinose efflux permease